MSPWSIVVSSKQARLVITEVVLEAGYGCVAFLLTPFFFTPGSFLVVTWELSAMFYVSPKRPSQ
jgi:hypothetical protein